MLRFEWDPVKAKANMAKHRVGFEEAATVFGDTLGIIAFDPDHSEEEDRSLAFGLSEAGRLLMVAHTHRADRIRIISARELTRMERKDYEDEIQRRNG